MKGVIAALQHALIPIGLTQNKEGKTIVRIGLEGKPREIDLANETQCKDFYEDIVEQVKNFYETATQEAMHNQSQVRIGFHS